MQSSVPSIKLRFKLNSVKKQYNSMQKHYGHYKAVKDKQLGSVRKQEYQELHKINIISVPWELHAINEQYD